MIVRRARDLAAPPEAVWDVIADPHRLPAWWPGVTRVEEVADDAWTKVLSSSRGRVVRADYTLLEREPQRRLAWRHEVAESPFERILADSHTEIELEPADGGATHVSIAVTHVTRGWAKLGWLQLRAAASKQLEDALQGLADVVEEREA